jgi:ribokinase
MLIVFGSIHMDLNLKVKSFPVPGETILSSSYSMTPGGKGANQAMAAARIGAKTALIGKVGDDGQGLRILNYLKRHEVMTSGVAKSEDYPTGIAVNSKEGNGERRTMIASGANLTLSAEQAPIEIFREGHILLVQMEVPLEQNAIAMKNAKEKGAQVILNLAPSLNVPKNLMSLVDYLIVNQIEAKQLAHKFGYDIKSEVGILAKKIATEGNLNCIITMGPAGVVAADKNGKGLRLPSLKLENVVDTTGAGDCFCGTFAAALHEKRSLSDALKLAVIASGLSCMKEGTLEGYPYLDDIEELMDSHPEVESF